MTDRPLVSWLDGSSPFRDNVFDLFFSLWRLLKMASDEAARNPATEAYVVIRRRETGD
jgi:hypothetical protein